MKKLVKVLSTLLLLLVTATKPAHAYLDPGTGSYILQLLVAGVLGGLFVLKSFWSSVREFLTGLFSKRKNDSVPKKRNGNK